MKLQILVPQYKETDDIVINLLNSIAIQQGIDLRDIEVLIMNDGTDVHLSEDLLKQYPFSIKYYLNEHLGLSGIRQALFNKSTADYVMWCDADDMFCSLLALNIIFTNIANNPGLEILIPVFVQEIKTKTGFSYIYKGMSTDDKNGYDGVFVHGKVYSRKFLAKNKIEWKQELTLNEDSYFNALAINIAKKVQICKTPYYLWKYNPNSTTRSESSYTLRYYSELLKSNICLVEQFNLRGLKQLAYIYVAQFIYNAYFTFNTLIVPPDLEQTVQNTKIELKEYIKNYDKYFQMLDPILKERVYKGQQATALGNKPRVLSVTFEDWYNSFK